MKHQIQWLLPLSKQWTSNRTIILDETMDGGHLIIAQGMREHVSLAHSALHVSTTKCLCTNRKFRSESGFKWMYHSHHFTVSLPLSHTHSVTKLHTKDHSSTRQIHSKCMHSLPLPLSRSHIAQLNVCVLKLFALEGSRKDGWKYERVINRTRSEEETKNKLRLSTAVK